MQRAMHGSSFETRVAVGARRHTSHILTIVGIVTATNLSLADHVCLAIIGEGTTHGWALVKALAPDGELGRIWSLSRPLTYRSIDRLVEAGLVERSHHNRRARLEITTAGRRARRDWLGRPVEHLRDLRIEFLLKLTLCERSGVEVRSLVARQRDALDATIDGLTATPPGDAVGVWRQESAEAARRFLARLGCA